MTRVRLTADSPVPPEMLQAVLKAEAITITFPGGKPIHVKGAHLIPPDAKELGSIEEVEEFIADRDTGTEVEVREVDCLHMAVATEETALALKEWIESLTRH